MIRLKLLAKLDPGRAILNELSMRPYGIYEAQIAEKLGLSKSIIRKHASKLKVKFIKIGKYRLYYDNRLE